MKTIIKMQMLLLLTVLVEGCCEQEKPTPSSFRGVESPNKMYLDDIMVDIDYYQFQHNQPMRPMEGYPLIFSSDLYFFNNSKPHGQVFGEVIPGSSSTLHVEISCFNSGIEGTYYFYGAINPLNSQNNSSSGSAVISEYYDRVKNKKFVFAGNLSINRGHYADGFYQDMKEGWIRVSKNKNGYDFEFDLTFSNPNVIRVMGHYYSN
jgi:hypothetical protein